MVANQTLERAATNLTEWQNVPLLDIVAFQNGKPHEQDVDKYGRYKLITLDSIGIDGVLKKEHKRTQVADDLLKQGDIVCVLSDIAHGRLLGLSDVIPEDDVYVLNQRMGRLRVTRSANPQYIRLQINRQQEHFRKRGQGTSQRHIYERDFAALQIPLPELVEQNAIVHALSDADAYIESLKQLLSKKRAVMQGAMQELLTGKRRLRGFNKAWTTAKLSQLAEIRSGGTPSTAIAMYWDGGIPWCTPTDITNLTGHKYISETSETISKQGLASSSAEMIPAGSVLMTSRATIGECAINVVPCTTNQGFKNFVPKAIDSEFLYYLLQSLKSEFISLCGGSTFLEIGKAQLTQFEICYPSMSEEQKTIATILSDMDAGIIELEAKLEKARNIKQGMAQELLTGKIRLI